MTDPFLAPTTLKLQEDGRTFLLLQPFTYYTLLPDEIESPYVRREADRTYIDVQPGLITDFASTPSWCWSFLPPIGRFTRACILHDFLYIWQVGNRRWADRVFLEAMKVSGTSFLRRHLYYWGVRLVAGGFWRKWQKHHQQQRG